MLPDSEVEAGGETWLLPGLSGQWFWEPQAAGGSGEQRGD